MRLALLFIPVCVFCFLFVSVFPYLVLSVASWGRVILAVSSSLWEWRFLYSYERYSICSMQSVGIKTTVKVIKNSGVCSRLATMHTSVKLLVSIFQKRESSWIIRSFKLWLSRYHCSACSVTSHLHGWHVAIVNLSLFFLSLFTVFWSMEFLLQALAY